MRFKIIQRKRKGGAVWCVDFTDAEGKRHLEVARDVQRNSTRDIAKARMRKLQDGCYAGTYSNAGVPFAELCRGFLAHVQVRANTERDYRVILDLHLLPFFGADTPVPEIDVARIEALRAHLCKEGRTMRDGSKRGLRPATVNKAMTLLVMVLNRAVKHKIIASNPALHVDKVKTERKQRVRVERLLARDEVPAMLAKAPPRYAALLTTLVYSGMRISEALALRWRCVNLDAGILTVERALVRGVEGDAKSETSHRDIEVPPVLVKVLREHKMASARKADDDLCFPTETGQADNLQNVQKRGLAVALKRAGIKRATSLHDLRHGYASALLASGVPITRVSALLGHASPAITLSVYAHVMPKHKDDAAAKLEAFFDGQSGVHPVSQRQRFMP
jgi:integrase